MSAANSGHDDVDIRTTSDSSGVYNLKSVRAGEWLAYSVKIAAAGTYSVAFRVASSGGGGTVHLTVDGTNVTGAVVLPDTGGWDAWQTVTKTGVSLPAGLHLLKLLIDANGSGGTAADINWMKFSSARSAAASTPFSGTPVALPAKVEAENYDIGRRGDRVSRHLFRQQHRPLSHDSVDIQTTTDTGGGFKVKTAVAGEWLKYSVALAAAGTLTLAARVSSSGTGGTFHYRVDGVDKTGTLTVPNTGAWEAWTTVSKAGVAIAAGVHILRLVLDTNGLDRHDRQFQLVDGAIAAASATEEASDAEGRARVGWGAAVFSGVRGLRGGALSRMRSVDRGAGLQSCRCGAGLKTCATSSSYFRAPIWYSSAAAST